jgi:hypothetical protein
VVRSFLDQEIDVIDTQGSQLLVRTLEVKQQSTKGDVDFAVLLASLGQQICRIPEPPRLSPLAKKVQGIRKGLLTYSLPLPPQIYTPFPNKRNQTYPPENSPLHPFPSILCLHPLWYRLG